MFKIVLVAVVLVSAVGTPAIAKPVVAANARIERVEKKQSFYVAWFKYVRLKLGRYAMAAS